MEDDSSPLVSVKRLQANAVSKLPLIETGLISPRENENKQGSLGLSRFRSPLANPKYFREQKLTEIASTGV